MKLIIKLEMDSSVVEVYEQYGVKMQAVFDVRKVNEKLWKYASIYCVNAPVSKSGTRMKGSKDYALIVAGMKWFVQEQI